MSGFWNVRRKNSSGEIFSETGPEFSEHFLRNSSVKSGRKIVQARNFLRKRSGKANSSGKNRRYCKNRTNSGPIPEEISRLNAASEVKFCGGRAWFSLTNIAWDLPTKTPRFPDEMSSFWKNRRKDSPGDLRFFSGAGTFSGRNVRFLKNPEER